MIIRTEDIKQAANIIAAAVGLDKNAANLELCVEDNYLCMSVTNREYFVKQKFLLEEPETFRAVVDANLFLNLISGLNTETIKLMVDTNIVLVTAGKSKYKLPLIFNNDTLMTLPTITLTNCTVEMPISNEVLKSILTVNSKELLKVKNIDVDELQKLYYITEEGCFTFTTGACFNSFTLEKPVRMLLNDRIVKLFKLFKEDVQFRFGYDALADGTMQTKVVFETPATYVAAIITNNEVLLDKIAGPCRATKGYINEAYPIRMVVSTNEFMGAISRALAFTKNINTAANMLFVPVSIDINNDILSFTDNFGNTEAIGIEDGSWVADHYTMKVNLADLKLVLDSCREQHVTINCGNSRSVIVNHGAVYNLIPEVMAE